MDIEKIIRTFCAHRSVSVDDVVSGNSRTINETKYMIWIYLHCEKKMSANQIAKRFNRIRPSVFRGIRIIKHLFKYHGDLCEEYHAVVKKIEGMAEATPSVDMMEEKI